MVTSVAAGTLDGRSRHGPAQDGYARRRSPALTTATTAIIVAATQLSHVRGVACEKWVPFRRTRADEEPPGGDFKNGD
jgi:hypothetical protein